MRINALTKELLRSGDITDIVSLQSMLKEMLKQGVETLLAKNGL